MLPLVVLTGDPRHVPDLPPRSMPGCTTSGRSRRNLTLFYLALSVGGVLGGCSARWSRRCCSTGPTSIRC
jgi:hypothetical protein